MIFILKQLITCIKISAAKIQKKLIDCAFKEVFMIILREISHRCAMLQ